MRCRVRPHDALWPSPAQWAVLHDCGGGRLIRVHSPFSGCGRGAAHRACRYAITYLRDEPGLTQRSGDAGARISRPSAYAVRARDAADVAAAVEFARQHRLLPVIKSAGHRYQRTSDAPDSLLIGTRDMDRITIEESFQPVGRASERPHTAVSIAAGAVWMDAYHAVTTVAGRYVQGGDCATVGVAGLVQSGGFGSFSKHFGTRAAALLRAEVATAGGGIRRVNANRDADLFWPLKGVGGTFGVVTGVWLRVRELPDQCAAVFATIPAHSDAAFRRVIDRFTLSCRENLINPHWGETVTFHRDRELTLWRVPSGRTRAPMEAPWGPFFTWVRAAPQDLQLQASLLGPTLIGAIPARHGWDARFWERERPGTMTPDPRPGAPTYHPWWMGDGAQAGAFVHGHASRWLPRALLDEPQRERLADALFDASRRWDVTRHFRKGLAEAPRKAVEAARDTAMNPAALDAFALAILRAGGPSTFPALPGANADLTVAHREAPAITRSSGIRRRIVPGGGSYVSESDYFHADWQHAFCSAHYPGLSAVKMKYDPASLFFLHHGVGSEYRSADGFSPKRRG